MVTWSWKQICLNWMSWEQITFKLPNSLLECFTPVFLNHFSAVIVALLAREWPGQVGVCVSGQGYQHFSKGAGSVFAMLPLSSVANVKFRGICGLLPFAGCNDKGCCKRTCVSCRDSDCKITLGESAAPLLLSVPVVTHSEQKSLVFWKPPVCLCP